MKIRYHIATISFSSDLLREDAEAVPIGILMLGESASNAMALLAVREDDEVLAKLPPLIRSIVKDFPALVRAQLEEILHNEANGSIDQVLDLFEDSLRNSFFVSDLKVNQQIEIEDPDIVPADPWRVAYPQVVKAATERMVAVSVPAAMRQHFRPWIHRSEAQLSPA